MNHPFTKLNQQEQEQAATHEQTVQPQVGREFATVEDMLRYDAEEVLVPGTVAQRLQKSIQREAIKPPRTWWQRWFDQ